MTEVSRRRMFAFAGAGVALAGAGAAGAGIDRALDSSNASAATDVVPFTGAHQAGIVTPAQENLHFAALDVTTKDRAELVSLLKTWTDAARKMTAGQEVGPAGAVNGAKAAPPSDTGEALELPASALTLTIGFGPSLFDDRFGLAAHRPDALTELPAFPKDKLDPARSGGDLCIQACANDPQVAVHAVRNLVRLGFGKAEVRWSQLGFGRSSSTSTTQSTPRNLFGFKDGTNNLKAEDTGVLDEQVWVSAADGKPWLAGGSYLVARRIRMHIETWDRTSLDEQEKVIGRTKGNGAALGQTAEFDPVDLQVGGADGEPMVPEDSHIRLAAAESLNGVKILRRGYNFVDGSDGVGHLEAGLFFICFNRDPGKQYIPMQKALSSKDAMMEYVQHTGSALFAVPPGVSETGYWGDTLFEA
ncbi:iron uptake transporter deferrochelatase/peroxidase subunit [Amycolatopsis pithecellobii]|uniref:Deferrochelatase n=1 Tax=Amycolatopsis pithecellobii TaxID=664692 RepID=A0A6N7YSA4_9PSEU|nr:iron uptake transporter deferrochelatase/peroxidase subunit [Amycolatopsis pithecellobii]MTD54818.1 deferrochelatase/peroxidase EfeB [Amycolatopsis pithecellobii]